MFDAAATREQRIKELKLGIKADRLSCSTFIANQFRLLLSQAAYILMLSIRQAAHGTQLAKAQVERLRLVLIKGAAKVTVSTRRILVEWAAFCPFAKEIRQIAQNLSQSPSFKFE
jgi:Transposase DDE domain group 1